MQEDQKEIIYDNSPFGYALDEHGFVDFGTVCRAQIGMQCQYGSRYADPRWLDTDPPYPYCAEGLRIQGTSANYHGMRIHKDDVAIFVQRVKEARHRAEVQPYIDWLQSKQQSNPSTHQPTQIGLAERIRMCIARLRREKKA